MENKIYCGMDVSKKKLDVVLLVKDKFFYKVFENSKVEIFLSNVTKL